jgi:predicted flap endonuclease-1-like 5' DNA nuclease
MDWLIVLIFILVVILVWLFLMINAKRDQPDILADIHPSSHPHEAADRSETAAEDSIVRFIETEPVVESDEDQFLGRGLSGVDIGVEDLTLIEGIGPKVNRLLHENGISSFKDLASTELARLRDILDSAGFRYMDPGSWAEQAGLLAENRVQEFQELIKKLKGGRKEN